MVVVSKLIGRTVFLFWQNVTNFSMDFGWGFFPCSLFFYIFTVYRYCHCRPAGHLLVRNDDRTRKNSRNKYGENHRRNARHFVWRTLPRTCTWTTTRRRKPVSETRDLLPSSLTTLRHRSSARNWFAHYRTSETRIGYRASKRTRARHTTCSDCRRPSPVIIISDSQTVVTIPNTKPMLTNPVSKFFDKRT